MSVMIDQIETAECTKESLPEYRVGDTLRVHQSIVEGKKKRIQRFEGTLVKVQGKAQRESITLRKVLDGIGIEKSFLVQSPLVEKIELLRQGKVRRAKLNYLRQRIGSKASRIKSRETA